MTDSSEKGIEFEQAFLKFQSSAAPVGKKGKNPHYKSSYARYEDVVAHVGPLLHEAGLSFRHTSRFEHGQWFVGTMLIHAETEETSELFEMPVSIGKMQEMGSAITYAKRYTLMALLGLPSEDDDGSVASRTPAKVANPANPELYTGTKEQKIQLMKWAKEKEIADNDLKGISEAWMGLTFSKEIFNEITQRWD